MLALDASTAGEIELAPGESVSSTRAQLRQIAARLDRQIRIWTEDGKVYFGLVPEL